MSSTTIRADIAASAQTISPSWAPEGGHAAPTPGTPINSNTLTAMADGLKNVISSSVATPKLVSLEGSLGAASSLTADVETTTTANSITGHVNSVHSGVSVADVSSSLQHFGIADYLVFVVMLIICALIGFYFGFIEKKQKSQSGGKSERRDSEALDYLVGGRKMKVLPVSLSLVASFVSGISLLGTSTEIYVYGTQYSFVLITLVLSGIISWYVFLPVFCNLQLTSTYEYFEMRYGPAMRYVTSVLFIVGMLTWLPVVMYVTALTFNQVSGINIHIITPIVCIVCIFYTCVGGLKAVIWTDVVQSVSMYGSVLLVCIKGTMDIGGLDVLIQRSAEGGRLRVPEMTFDPTVRLSAFAVLFGGTIHNVHSAYVNQVTVQRYLSLPNLAKANQALWVFTILLVFLISCCNYLGLLTFATFYDCDPLVTKLAYASDQLPVLLMMRTLGNWPGMPGVFVAGVFSAALSSLSTGLNSLACVISQDLVKPLLRTPMSERQMAILLRSIVVVFGVCCIGLIFLVEKMGTVLELSATTGAVTMGPSLGIFFMAICLPWIDVRSAFAGLVTSFAVITWICTNAQLGKMSGEIRHPKLPVSVEGCTYEFSNTTVLDGTLNHSEPAERNIYYLSFVLYTATGALIAIIVGGVATLFFGTTNLEELNPALITPFMRRFLPKNKNYLTMKLREQSMQQQDQLENSYKPDNNEVDEAKDRDEINIVK